MLFLRYLSFCTLCKSDTGGTSGEKGDPTSSKFTEQWVESCDEAEKEIIYKSAYKTYIVLNKVIPILLLLTLIANMFLNTGILAVLVVAVIYLVTGMTYIRSSMVSKAKGLDKIKSHIR